MRKKIKQHNIRIFYELETEAGTVKQYIHSKNSYLKANVRQLSAYEQSAANAMQDASEVEFTINRRDIDVDMFVEFKRFGELRVYQISGKDNFMFFDTDISFRGYQVNKKSYIEVRWA